MLSPRDFPPFEVSSDVDFQVVILIIHAFPFTSIATNHRVLKVAHRPALTPSIHFMISSFATGRTVGTAQV